MTDFALHRATGAVFDISTSADDIESDDGMYTAVLISLFCDAACALDELPAGEAFRGGYFGDTFELAGDSVGSKLRLLDRERRSTYVLRRAESYARDALAGIVGDMLLSGVTFSRQNSTTSVLSLVRPEAFAPEPPAEREWKT